MSHTVVQEARPFDHVYDPVGVVSSSKDFDRATAAALSKGGKRVAVRQNLFSALPHYPPTVFASSGTRGLPAIAETHNPHASTAAPSRPLEALVHGQSRYKYYKRPPASVLETADANVKLDPKYTGHASQSPRQNNNLQSLTPEEDEENQVEYFSHGARSLAVQTMYRDSTAQTDPYTPDYVLEPGAKQPEVLKLAHLRHGGEQGKSLPAGRAEIEAIDLARRRARIEASLPPTTDEASFEIRKMLMEQLELASFKTRESEIDLVHNDRLALVEQELRQREAERDFVAEQRVEELRRKLENEKELTLASIASRRIKLLRKMGKQRQQLETHIDMLTGTGSFAGLSSGTGKSRKMARDIISEYADFGSKVYAPDIKDGRFPDKLRTAATLEVRATELQSADAIADFSQTLPPAVTKFVHTKAELPKATASNAKKEEGIARDLQRIHAAIVAAKAGRSSCEAENERVPAWRKPKPVVVRPKTPTIDGEEDITGGHNNANNDDGEVELAILLLQTLLRGRAVQNVMFEGKERRLELIHEMRADLLTADAVAAIETEERGRKREEDVRVAKDALVDTATGEVAAATLDFFSKELIRQREMQNAAAFAAVADEERRKREAEETAKRNAELVARAKRAERERQLAAIHSSTASTFVDSIVDESINAAATAVAALEATIRHFMVGPVIDELEIELQKKTDGAVAEAAASSVVRDLLSSVVVNAVNFEMQMQADTAASEHFQTAAEDAVAVALEATSDMLKTGEVDPVAAVEAANKRLQEQNAAATKIQRIARGRAARNRVKLMRAQQQQQQQEQQAAAEPEAEGKGDVSAPHSAAEEAVLSPPNEDAHGPAAEDGAQPVNDGASTPEQPADAETTQPVDANTEQPADAETAQAAAAELLDAAAEQPIVDNAAEAEQSATEDAVETPADGATEDKEGETPSD